MNLTFVLGLFVALWCGLSMAKDEPDNVVYKLDESSIQSRDLYAAAAAFFGNPRSLQKSTLGQGRFIGSGMNWNLVPSPFKNYLLTKEEDKTKDEDKDKNTDKEMTRLVMLLRRPQ